MEYYNFLVISLCALFYTLILQAKELQMLQQNSYRNTRYLKWLKKNALTFSRICDTVLLALLFIFKNYLSGSDLFPNQRNHRNPEKI